MKKSLFLIIFSIWTFHINGQYKLFPKLENLYNNNHYDKCLEKSEAALKSNPIEIWPSVWQLRCYLAINEMEKHPLKKNALAKALNIALRIKKKDKQEELNDDLKADYQKISEKTIQQINDLPETQYKNGLDLFEKLKPIDLSLNLDYQKYLFMKVNSDPNAFIVIKNLVLKHYICFKKNQQPLENLEEAYADLMNEYFEHDRFGYAKDVYFKADEVYRNTRLCKESYLNYIKNLDTYLGYYADENTLDINLLVCKTADSIFNLPEIKLTIQKIKKFYVVYAISNLPFKDKKTNNAILEYVKYYCPNEADSASTFFNLLTIVNSTENLKIVPHKINDYWINTILIIKKYKHSIEAIKHIHQYYLALKKYEEDALFLDDCSLNYPSLKLSLQPLKSELEKLIIEQISNLEYDEKPELIDKYAGKTTNKAIKEKQYKLYYTKLSELLDANNFSGFAVNIIKALHQFPSDPQLLALKKRWIIKDYKANYMSQSYGYETFFTKIPDESKCEAGIVNKAGHDAVLQKINYFRRLVGAPDSCIFDETLNVKCQQAALMMSANSALSHAPPKTWKCFTAAGASGASASNLSLGAAFYNAIIGQMEDDGSGNTACGHRRWILNPKNTVFGHGSTYNASSLYAFGTSNISLKRKLYFDEKQPICWPSADYFPIHLLPQRWSFSLIDADFEKAVVTVSENGKKLDVSLEPISYGYGPNTLVWIINNSITVNKTYTVTITNIIPYTPWDASKEEKLKTKTFTYQVIPIEIL